MSESKKFLYFTIGPVQGFVAQARRTRDFWAGSFLLSYLAGAAMLEVIEAGGELLLPAVANKGEEINDPLLKAIKTAREGGSPLDKTEIKITATLPNRFIASVPVHFDPSLCVKAVNTAWERVAGTVWQKYVAPAESLGRGTRQIWERQIRNFWEINWVTGEKTDSTLLPRRKNWRNYVFPVEEGDKCTLMGNWQEISGYLRVKGQRSKQEAFWAEVRRRAGRRELDENERLCAIALVKRLYPLAAEETIGWRMPEVERYPSTPYLAAVPWIAEVTTKYPEEARRYAAAASRLPGAAYRENPLRFKSLNKTLEQYPRVREFASLDGNCFFKQALSNPRLWENNEGEKKNGGGETGSLRGELVKMHGELCRKTGKEPSPFYAVLMMDGDRLGALLDKCDFNEVSAALITFSHQVEEVVQEHDGVLVYAGGDDVMAFFPLDGALAAAVALRRVYSKSFPPSLAGKATISGALVYAHYNTPLTAVIRQVHELLDRVAKEKTGRDSLAVTVWKGAGRVLTWSAPWDVIAGEGEGNLLDSLASSFAGEGRQEKEYSSSFFYHVGERFKILTADEEENGPVKRSGVAGDNKRAEVKLDLNDEDITDLLAAEYRKTREREIDWTTARARVERLLKVLRSSWRSENGRVHAAKGSLAIDGLLLVKFLAQKGVNM